MFKLKCNNCLKAKDDVKEYIDIAGEPKDFDINLCDDCAEKYDLNYAKIKRS